MRIFQRVKFSACHAIALLTCLLTFASGANAATTLSDIPVGSASNVPANLMLALSVEFPTGTVAAYKGTNDYSSTNTYLGYFDYLKCYDYDSTNKYFTPLAAAGSSIPDCTGHWSGNMLNWATMTALDEFRQSLTGGNRSIDEDNATGNTVLLRSNLNSQSTSGNFPDKNLAKAIAKTTIGDSNYNNITTVYIRNYAQSSSFQISNNSSFSSSGQGNSTTTYQVAVQVCVSGKLESNCNSNPKNSYPGSGQYNKPEGLIQQNYQRIRVGAAGYVFQSGSGPANGAVRALVQDNGPDTYNGNGARTACSNTKTQWSCTTGAFKTDPEGAASLNLGPGAKSTTLSGAINYLNKFGYDNGYETYDTLADLYWASLAYLMNVPLDSSYTSGLTSSNSMDTKFPVYSGSSSLNDPIQYQCQANSIVTIGDSHTWYDTRVPSTGSPPAGTGQGTLSPVNGADAGLYATKLGNLPLIEGAATPKTMASFWGSGTSLGNQKEPNGTTNSTYNMAGLAYFAHTQDVRPYSGSDSTQDQLPGKQTVDTYTVDVLEPGAYDGTSGKEIYNPAKFSTSGGAAGPNMYWLAAKYGGFNDINGDGVPANFLTWHTNSSTEAALNLRPDNYFPGNRPDLIQQGLAQIFNKVSTSPQSAAGPAVTVSRILTNIPGDKTAGPYYSPVSGFPIYTVSYTPSTWVGDVTGYVASANVPGSVSPVTGSLTWSAQGKLDSLAKAAGTTGTYGWNSGRRIITYSGSAGIPFRYSSLTATQQTAVQSSGLLNFLRGDQSTEGTTYRSRTHILGDVVHSEAVLVQGAQSPKYSESFNPGYSAFTTSVTSRAPVVYAGANDGMLHAFEADFLVPGAGATNQVTGGGSELFAYVPSLTFNGPTAPMTDGLAALSILNGVTKDSSGNFLSYAHHFYVDATPAVADVDFNYVAAATYVAPPSKSTATTAKWHTILVGGLGKGGKGYYALDITSVPSSIDTTSSNATVEQALATQKVLWEFTDTDMGYSYGDPLIVKTRKYGWVVLLTSGYNNPSGKGHLYVVNPKTGALLEKFDTTAGTAANPSGLTHATGYTQDISDNTVEQVYAGDLLGNVWRFDLSSSSTASYPAPTLIATLVDSSNKPQPVTTAPRVELDLNSNDLDTRRWVFIGTGKALDASDLTNTQQQTMYAIRDGDGAAPANSGFPVSRNTTTMQHVTDLKLGVAVADTDAGWYYDLTGSAGTNGGTERIVVDPDAAAGVYTLTWATMTPTSNPCNLAGNIYAVSFGSGASVLVDSAGNSMAYLQVQSAPTKIEQVQLPGTSTLAILYGQASGSPQMGQMRQGNSGNVPQRVNWREILNN
ncbi:PilC/PilY family type IV pilus protein [Dyella jiangningensis]|uniref:pilus assembly protein n=1 Tax=Dyella jiangningensis TaxID=1379159 RepID=UPI00240FD009|nr:PilC/PilY family type IV pilus protein [Dyella jiangningensis]MDG2537279.1 PilC/PilY family type IV pilus protein [Dyella jiangningensis]